MLEANRKALESHQPLLWHNLSKLRQNAQSAHHYDASQKVFLKGKPLYGASSPNLLVGRWLSALSLAPATCYVLCGFGSGLHVERLMDRLDPSCVLVVLESDLPWLAELFARKDCSRLLNHQNLHILAGECEELLPLLMHQILFTTLNDVQPLLFAPSFNAAQHYYESTLAAFVQSFKANNKLQTTELLHGATWQELTLLNLPYIADAPDVSALAGIAKKLPVILVAAGPSLDESIDFLKSVQNKALIIAVNSAYRALYNKGITPHLTLAADPNLDTWRGYEGCDISKTALICTSFVCPKVAKAFAGRIFTWSSDSNLLTYIRSQAKQPKPTAITEAGTISACIADLATLWGSQKICFVGQDLAIRASGQTHTTDSFYQDQQRNFAKLQNCEPVPGNTDETVYAESRLYTYLKTIESMVARSPKIDFINTARHGAKIQGVPFVEHEKALVWVGQGNSTGLSDAIAKALASAPVQKAPASTGLKKLRIFAENLYALALESASFIESLDPKFSQANYADHKNILRADTYSDAVNTLIESAPEEYQVLVNGSLAAELVASVREQHLVTEGASHWKELQKNKSFFWAQAQGARFVLTRMGAMDSSSALAKSA